MYRCVKLRVSKVPDSEYSSSEEDNTENVARPSLHEPEGRVGKRDTMERVKEKEESFRASKRVVEFMPAVLFAKINPARPSCRALHRLTNCCVDAQCVKAVTRCERTRIYCCFQIRWARAFGPSVLLQRAEGSFCNHRRHSTDLRFFSFSLSAKTPTNSHTAALFLPVHYNFAFSVNSLSLSLKK